jgi:hypothetical protein
LIPFRFKADRVLALAYAQELGDAAAVAIIETGVIGNEDQARILAQFFWRMVGASVEDNVMSEMEDFSMRFRRAATRRG